MKRYLADVNNNKLMVIRYIIKIGIIVSFLVPLLDQLHIWECFTGLNTSPPFIVIFIPFSNFFSFSWLSDFWDNSPFSINSMIFSLDSRKWTGEYFYLIIPEGKPAPIGLAVLRNFNNLLILEAVIFLSGLVLFLISLFHSSRRTVKEQNRITTGIYKYIRHPQNLALIIMAFPFTLYVPVCRDYGICFGDLLCWVQFIVLLTLYSDYTDYRLKKQFPEVYLKYYQQTGFFLPKLFSIEEMQFSSIFKRPILRYLCLSVIYLLSVLTCIFIYQIIDWPPIRIYC